MLNIAEKQIPTASGLILAGGLSRRMGRDKSMLILPGGEPILWRTIRILSEITDDVLIVGGPTPPTTEPSCMHNPAHDANHRHLPATPSVGRTSVSGTPSTTTTPSSCATPSRTVADTEVRATSPDTQMSVESAQDIPISVQSAPNFAFRHLPDDIPGSGPLGGLLTGLLHIRNPYAIAVAVDLPFLNAALLRYLLSLAPGYDAVVPRVDGSSQPTHAIYRRDIHPLIAERLASNQRKAQELLHSLHVRWVEDEEINAIDPEHISLINVNTPDDWDNALRRAVAGE